MIDWNVTCATNLFSCWIPNTNCALGLLWATSFKFSTSSWIIVGRVSNWAGFIDPGYIDWLELTWYCRIASTSLRTSCALIKRQIGNHSSWLIICFTIHTWKWDGLHFDHGPSALMRVSWHRWAAAARWATSRRPVPPVVWCPPGSRLKLQQDLPGECGSTAYFLSLGRCTWFSATLSGTTQPGRVRAGRTLTSAFCSKWVIQFRPHCCCNWPIQSNNKKRLDCTRA